MVHGACACLACQRRRTDGREQHGDGEMDFLELGESEQGNGQGQAKGVGSRGGGEERMCIFCFMVLLAQGEAATDGRPTLLTSRRGVEIHRGMMQAALHVALLAENCPVPGLAHGPLTRPPPPHTTTTPTHTLNTHTHRKQAGGAPSSPTYGRTQNKAEIWLPPPTPRPPLPASPKRPPPRAPSPSTPCCKAPARS